MSSCEEIVLNAIRRTLFLATNIEDLSGVLKLGEVQHALVARKPYWYSHKYNCPIHIDELEYGKRVSSISDIIHERESLIQKRMSDVDYIWSFRPHTWTDDFALLGKKSLCWDYYLYTYWSSKHHQEKLLLENASSLLKEHLIHKHSQLKRQFLWSSELQELSDQWIVSQRESIAGQGVFLSPQGAKKNPEKNVLYRAEKKVWPHIPVCQIAAVAGGQSVCFQPSVMIIKEHEGHLDYLGSDFNISPYIPEGKIREITRLTKAVGNALDKAGFQGTYNCDYIFSPETGELYFAEVNPRNSGCQFMLDDKYASDRISGQDDALFYMPMVLNLYAHIFSKLPPSVTSYISKDTYIPINFSEKQASSFAHLNAVRAGIADNSNPEMTDENGEIWAIKTADRPIIVEPFVPTGLTAEEERLY
jgi:hypothetical protein